MNRSNLPFSLRVFRCMVLIAVLGGTRTSAHLSAQRAVEFDTASPSFGLITEAPVEDLSIDVSVVNRSDESFDFRQVQIGCGCMEAEVANPGSLGPGESGVIRVTLKWQRIRVGTTSFPLSVMDGDKLVTSVPVTYTYEPRAVADHVELFMDGEAGESSPASTTIRVRGKVDERQMPRAACDNSAFSVTLHHLPGTDSEDARYQLDVSCASASPPAEATAATITIYLPGSTKPDLSIPLRYAARPPVTAHPRTVLLKGVKAGAEVRRTVRLTSKAPFTVKSVTSTIPEIAVAAKERGGTNPAKGPTEQVYELVVRPTVTNSQSTLEGEIWIEVDGPTAFRLVVPVVGEITPEN
jgi:hypothetical protein